MTDLQQAKPSLAVYAPIKTAVATLLGGPLGGTVLLFCNERAFGRIRQGWIIFASGFFYSTLMITTSMILPPLVSRALGVASVFAAYSVAKSRLKQPLPLSSPPQKPGGWPLTLAIGIACFALSVALAILLAIAFGWVPES
jgi:hypothetical protein